jgi:hypothetical protein
MNGGKGELTRVDQWINLGNIIITALFYFLPYVTKGLFNYDEVS